jgi:hypothetical protein
MAGTVAGALTPGGSRREAFSSRSRVHDTRSADRSETRDLVETAHRARA